MVIIIYGTIGEYIKLFPLIKKLRPENCLTINVNMQPEQMEQLFAESDLPKPTISVLNGHRGNDIDTIPQMLVWVTALFYHLLKLRKKVRSFEKGRTIFIVHGDTIIAPIAGLVCKYIYRIPLGHIEAGYRSGNWRQPFPEELDRIIADKLADVNYAPGKETAKNIIPPKTKGRLVDTKHNTVRDALTLARENNVIKVLHNRTLPKKYVLVSMHRSEAISNKSIMSELVKCLAEAAKNNSYIVWLDHAPTREKITQYNLDKLLDSNRIVRIPKLPYFQFISIVSKASSIITDSGGLQEEAYLLGIPTLIHRQTNEKPTMGVLSDFKKDMIVKFLDNYQSYKDTLPKREISPTEIIFKDLKQYGFLGK